MPPCSLETWQKKGGFISATAEDWFNGIGRFYYGRRLPEEDKSKI